SRATSDRWNPQPGQSIPVTALSGQGNNNFCSPENPSRLQITSTSDLVLTRLYRRVLRFILVVKRILHVIEIFPQVIERIAAGGFCRRRTDVLGVTEAKYGKHNEAEKYGQNRPQRNFLAKT